MSSHIISYLLSILVSTGIFPAEIKPNEAQIIEPTVVQEQQIVQSNQTSQAMQVKNPVYTSQTIQTEQANQPVQTNQTAQEIAPVTIPTYNYEPNNTKDQAINIAGSIASDISSTSDVDFFEFNYQANTIVEITVNKSVQFQTEAEGKIIRSTISGEFKKITFASTKNAKIIIEIKGAPQNYALNVSTKTTSVMTVNKIMQEQSQWCWAAVGQITASTMRNYGFATTPTSQAEIVSQIHNNTDNLPARSISETANAVTFAIKDSGKRGKALVGALSKEEILKNVVVENEPIVMRVGNGEKNGHFVVITGVEIENNEVYLYIQDPLDRNMIKTSLTNATTSGYKQGDSRVWNYTVEII